MVSHSPDAPNAGRWGQLSTLLAVVLLAGMLLSVSLAGWALLRWTIWSIDVISYPIMGMNSSASPLGP